MKRFFRSWTFFRCFFVEFSQPFMKITLQIKLLFFRPFLTHAVLKTEASVFHPSFWGFYSSPKMCFAAFLLLLLQFRFWDSGFICDHGLIPSRKIEMFCDTKKSGVWQIRLAKSFLKPSQIIPWCEHAFRNRRKFVRETGHVCFQVSSRFKIVWTWQYICRANRFSANLKRKPFLFSHPDSAPVFCAKGKTSRNHRPTLFLDFFRP